MGVQQLQILPGISSWIATDRLSYPRCKFRTLTPRQLMVQQTNPDYKSSSAKKVRTYTSSTMVEIYLFRLSQFSVHTIKATSIMPLVKTETLRVRNVVDATLLGARFWVHGCDPGRVSDGSRLALCQTLSIECPPFIFFWHLFFAMIFLFLFLCRFLFVCVFHLLSLELW